MSGGTWNYDQYKIDEIADSIAEEIAQAKKPRPPKRKRHYISIKKQIGDWSRIEIQHHCDTLIGARSWLLDDSYYNVTEKDGHLLDIYDQWTDSNGNDHPCEYFVKEVEEEEYEEGHDECYYGTEWSEETLAEFANAVKALRRAYVYAQRVDWLMAGDDDQESFHERLKDELSRLEEQ